MYGIVASNANYIQLGSALTKVRAPLRATNRERRGAGLARATLPPALRLRAFSAHAAARTGLLVRLRARDRARAAAAARGCRSRVVRPTLARGATLQLRCA